MPQFDVSSFGTQLFWLTLVFGVLYIAISRIIAPKAESIMINRNRYLEENITASENDYGKAESLRKEKCIDLAAFIIEKITDKPADLKLLEKIYREK